MLWRGFVYDVYDWEDQTVIKIPRTSRYRKEVEENSYQIHKQYLWMWVAESNYVRHENTYRVIQEKIEWNPIDLMNTTNNKVNKILEHGKNMQNAENILFDVFWLAWMIRLFNHYYEWKWLKAFWDICLPINKIILDYFYNFPPKLLAEMNEQTWNPFIAHNLLEDKDWNMRLIDTDFRPLDKKHPLNLAGNWITQKALDDIKKK